MPETDSRNPGRRRVSRHVRERLARADQRCVEQYLEAPRVPAALAERFVDRIEPIRMVPQRLLELGSAVGTVREQLRIRYPECQLIALERSHAFCRQLKRGDQRTLLRRLFSAPSVLCAQATALPVASASVDLVCANLSWVLPQDVPRVMQECVRVLRAPGLLMTASYGPQTLVELRQAWAQLDQHEHLHAFVDMHDVGDAMVSAGLADVVVDSERARVEFDDMAHLLRELRVLGGGNRAPMRRRGLSVPRTLQRLDEHYRDIGAERSKLAVDETAPGLSATVEFVFAHAWLTQRPGTPVLAPQLHPRPDSTT